MLSSSLLPRHTEGKPQKITCEISMYAYEAYCRLVGYLPRSLRLADFRLADDGRDGVADAALRGLLHLRMHQRSHLRIRPHLLRRRPKASSTTLLKLIECRIYMHRTS